MEPLNVADLQPVQKPVAAPAPQAAPADPVGAIPDEVLQIPLVSAMLQGKPPAIFAAKGTSTPETQVIEKNAQPLMKVGFGFYRPLDDSGTVMFNQAFVSSKELKAADKAGRLDDIAPSLQEVSQAFGGMEAPPAPEGASPAPDATGAPSAPASIPAPTPNKAITTARVKNLSPGSPSSGPVPGQGRILNNIIKPVV